MSPAGDPLFIALTGTQAEVAEAQATADPTVIRARAVEINPRLLDPRASTLPTQGRRVVFNLFEDVSLVAILDLVEPAEPGVSVWSGTIEGIPEGVVTLVVRDGVVQASITAGRSTYQVRYVDERTHAIREIDPSAFPDDIHIAPTVPALQKVDRLD